MDDNVTRSAQFLSRN